MSHPADLLLATLMDDGYYPTSLAQLVRGWQDMRGRDGVAPLADK
jgi:hypothetical protein